MSRSDKPASPWSSNYSSACERSSLAVALQALDKPFFTFFCSIFTIFLHISWTKRCKTMFFTHFLDIMHYFTLFARLATVGSQCRLAQWAFFVLIYQGGEGFRHRLDPITTFTRMLVGKILLLVEFALALAVHHRKSTLYWRRARVTDTKKGEHSSPFFWQCALLS